MATGNLAKNISEEAMCSLCLEHFKDPVTLDCGHNFCQACITQCLEKAPAGPFCPQCRQAISPGNLKPNRQLANLIELIKKLEVEKEEEEKGGMCEKHKEPLKLFCKEDEMLICVVCHLSKEHKTHNVVPLDEASEEYKEKIKDQIPSLEKRKKELEALHSVEEQKSKKLMTLLEKEKQEALSAFERLQEALEQNKRAWLWRMDVQGEKMKRKRARNAAQLLSQITDLNSLIAEIQQKCQQPACEFLQGIAKTLDLSKKYNYSEDPNLVVIPFQEPELSLKVFMDKRAAFEKIFKDCQDGLENTLRWGMFEDCKTF